MKTFHITKDTRLVPHYEPRPFTVAVCGNRTRDWVMAEDVLGFLDGAAGYAQICEVCRLYAF